MLIKTFDSEDVYDILDDIQRVEKNCLYLKKRILALCGIDLTLNIKEDWTREDIPTIEEMERIRGNCEKIIRVMDDKSLIPVFNDTFSYIQANSLENALKSTDEMLQRLITLIDRPRAGFYFASEPLVLIAGRE